ncbi:DJ-1/PfpI family protein [Streptomyces sp. NPDC059070]|uniref:DJ-1/PfpI family protein n=1 Tax=unclassified Streptomyces TaxID=2593676 RepID=UPI0034E2F9E4
MNAEHGQTRRGVLRSAVAGGVGAGLAATIGAGTPAHAAAPRRIRVAVLLYEGVTALDAVGPYEVLCRVPDVRVTMVAKTAGPVRTDTGELTLVAERALSEVPRAEVLLVPGGGQPGALDMMKDTAVHDWIRRIDRHSLWTTSVCTGALILGAAGLLRGVPAATYWAARPMLKDFGAIDTPGRFVESGKIITAAGVSAGIDMGLHLAARLSDDRTAQAMQLGIEYDPQPPYDTGSPEKADPELRKLALKLLDDAGRAR